MINDFFETFEKLKLNTVTDEFGGLKESLVSVGQFKGGLTLPKFSQYKKAEVNEYDVVFNITVEKGTTLEFGDIFKNGKGECYEVISGLMESPRVSNLNIKMAQCKRREI